MPNPNPSSLTRLPASGYTHFLYIYQPTPGQYAWQIQNQAREPVLMADQTYVRFENAKLGAEHAWKRWQKQLAKVASKADVL
jgi:hypothetical protein